MSLTVAREEGQKAAEALLNAIDEFKGRLSSRVLRIASAIETTDGNINATAGNIALVDQLVASMKLEFLDDELADAIIAYIDSLGSVGQNVLDVFSEFEDEIDPELVEAIEQRYRANVATYVADPDTYDDSIWSRVSSNLIYGIATGSVLSETMDNLAETVESATAADSVASVVVTAPMELQRMATVTLAEEVGAEFFLYQGRPIKTTRPFCAEREGIVWHREEINEWGRDAARGADLDGDGNGGWSGMVEVTNEQTIWVHLGGWYGNRQSCRHVLIPLPRSRVPAEDLERMRRKGLI
jgi:hypothetical protein